MKNTRSTISKWLTRHGPLSAHPESFVFPLLSLHMSTWPVYPASDKCEECKIPHHPGTLAPWYASTDRWETDASVHCTKESAYSCGQAPITYQMTQTADLRALRLRRLWTASLMPRKAMFKVSARWSLSQGMLMARMLGMFGQRGQGFLKESKLNEDIF